MLQFEQLLFQITVEGPRALDHWLKVGDHFLPLV